MTFAAEPYGVFVDDLVSGLTGAVVREQFRFLPEQEPFKLAHADVVAETVRAHGLAGGAFTRFRPADDFTVAAGGVVAWRRAADGAPAAGAVWPDAGSRFWASYERAPDPGAPPLLTDRNPGSVVRTLAESFAREYAVLSLQMEAVYRAAFLETAEGDDLDNVAALVGIERRTDLVASGELDFTRSSPAPADVSIPEGTLVSTADVPAVTVETTEARTLRSGTLSVTAPVRAMVPGAAGVAGAGTLTVMHRPLLGIERVANPQPLAFRGGAETDAALRRRAARALETSGRATPASIVGALTSVAGIREQDVRIVEDHNAFPGILKITVAADFAGDDPRAARAVELIEAYRPAGIRVLHNLPPPSAVTPPSSPGNGGEEGIGPPGALPDGVFSPIGVRAVITAASSALGAEQRRRLLTGVEDVVRGFVGDRGIGDAVVYNAVVAAIMAVEGVFDVSLELFRPGVPGPSNRRNLLADPPDTRPRLDELHVELRGEQVALDFAVSVQRKGSAATSDAGSALAGIRDDIQRRLTDRLATLGEAETITVALFQGTLTGADDYEVHSSGVHYTAEFVQEGLRVLVADPEIVPSANQAPVVRAVAVTE